MRIEIPEFSLIAMIGATSSGKTTFANRHFKSTEVLSSDFFRGMISDDENNQAVSREAFDLLYYAAEKRLKLMKTTVIDATNLTKATRTEVIELGRRNDVHTVAIVLNLPEELLLKRNAERDERRYPARVIHNHYRDLKRSIKELKREGFRFVYVISSEEELDNVEIVRTKMYNDMKSEQGPFDIIGDIHGCADELTELLDKMGYVRTSSGVFAHPEGRKAVFVGDFCDRGPKNVEVLKIAMDMTVAGHAYAVAGNHDVKLVKYLLGKNIQRTHGIENTISELEKESEDFRDKVKNFLDGLISHYVFDDGRLVVAHAGIKQEYIGRGSRRVREFCLYGETTGETDEYGFPIRLDWASDYRGKGTVIYGHTASETVRELNGTFCIDTGCVYGGELTAYRYPERTTVSVKAKQEYYEPLRPLKPAESEAGDLIKYEDVAGTMHLNTKLMPSITIRENYSAAALEVMSRFSADPHWLIYLPPTMSPCETSTDDHFLEYPTEAFAYYRNHGITKVVCEKKHMGSRAVIVLCRNSETAKERFHVTDNSIGIIYTRTGRHFFDDADIENEILDRLNRQLSDTGFWSEFNTDWVCLDTELMPWSEKAQSLIRKQYASVGRAGRDVMAKAVELLEKTCERENVTFEVDENSSSSNVDPKELLTRFKAKKEAADLYTNAYREYCWKVNSVDDLRIAPFHLLASEGKVYSEETHVWHMETLKKYCTGADPIFVATPYLVIDVNDDDQIAGAVRWWLDLTGNGGEGMVVKPETYTAYSGTGILQPAIKCRGREYLRIIYGPDYLMPEYLTRLKKRSLSHKRSMALREFSLGLEALNRFAMKEPLYRVHECVFGVLALESEPVDPRL